MGTNGFKAIGEGLSKVQDGVGDFANNPTVRGISSAINALQPFPNTRLGYGISNRNQQIMTWRLPNGTNVQMYINPQNFEIRETKQIVPTRTKGGYVVQYWGGNLTQLTLRGTTGSSGIKGINVLNDIYNAENRAFELVAAAQNNELIQALESGNLGEEGIESMVSDAAKAIRERNFILRPSLASLATGIMLFYQGTQYKGFFTEFSTTESVQNLGLFDYSMTFMATEKRGSRRNFMAWHKDPIADDLGGQLLNSVGNAIRRSFGFSEQAPTQFHPENAPYSFGGNSVPGSLGFDLNAGEQVSRAGSTGSFFSKLIP